MNDRAARETRAIYAKADALWARYSCPASGECCQLAVTQRQPWLWPSEWRVLASQGPVPAARADGACPFLVDNRCSRYADRPLGCRTFFCHRIRGPERQPVTEMNALHERLARINELEDEHAEARPILEWCSR
ncbi:MAG: YkgJ family cysteine cluster protein [Archangiaceae bacterium]|nr:YkgJ family cysteine cluster protein [Archangiaceae bacterium]